MLNKLTKRLGRSVKHIKVGDLVTVMDFVGNLDTNYRVDTRQTVIQEKCFNALVDGMSRTISLVREIDQTDKTVKSTKLSIETDSGNVIKSVNGSHADKFADVTKVVRQCIAFFEKNREDLLEISAKLEEAHKIHTQVFGQIAKGLETFEKLERSGQLSLIN